MEKNKINLDNYFEQARNSKTDFDLSDARNLIENTDAEIAEPSKSIVNKIGNYVMNILSFTAAAAAIGVMSLGFFTSEEPVANIAQNEPIKNGRNYEALPEPDKDKKNNKISEKDDNVITFSGYTENEKAKTEKYELKSQQPSWIPKKEEKVDVKGINVVELDQNALNNLGVKFENGNIVTWLFGPERPQRAVVSKREVDLELNAESNENIPNIWPKMITDAQGNKLLMAFQDENTTSTVTKKISNRKRMQFVNQDGRKTNILNADTKTLFMINSEDQKQSFINKDMLIESTIEIDTNAKFDIKAVIERIKEKNPNISDDDLEEDNIKMIILSDVENEYDTIFTYGRQIKVKEKSNNSQKLLNNFLNNRKELLLPSNKDKEQLKKSNSMNSLTHDSLDIKSMIININKIGNVDIDLKNYKNILIDSISNNLNIVTNSDLDNIVIESDSSILKNVELLVPKVINNMHPFHYDFDKYIRINKLIPIKINLPDTEKTELIFWYDATEELLDILPEDIAANIAPEFEAAKESDEFCEAPATGGEKYFDIWRSCSGALENLTVYPNPTNGPINVKFILKEERYLNISLHDLNGNLVNDLKDWQKHGIGEIDLNLSSNKHLESGMYLVVVRTDKEEQVVQRVIIE